MQPADFLSREHKKRILAAIKNAECNTSGEIRLHIERKCRGDVLDRAAYIFGTLGMHRTRLRNGILFYLSIDDHKFAVLGDAGINAVTPENFWDEIRKDMLELFRDGRFADGLEKGILMAGEQLKAFFPYRDDDANELSDEISYE